MATAENTDPRMLAVAQKLDRTAQDEVDSLLAGLAVLPLAMRRIVLGSIVRKLTVSLVGMK